MKTEIARNEFRQVKFIKVLGANLIAIYKLQQKFLIPNGESYWAFDKRNELDICLGGTMSSTNWQPMKIEWRYLPEIDEKDV